MFRNARYPDGTPVALVAAANEFGTSRGTPERPFFRQAVRSAEDPLVGALKVVVDPETLAIDKPAAQGLGEVLKNEVQSSIVELRSPGNAEITIHGGVLWVTNRKGRRVPITIKGKRSTNPLINSGRMRRSVGVKVLGRGRGDS